jgi:hypothetical protein
MRKPYKRNSFSDRADPTLSEADRAILKNIFGHDHTKNVAPAKVLGAQTRAVQEALERGYNYSDKPNP